MAIGDHSIGLIEHEYVDKRQSVDQVSFAPFLKQLPETTRGSDDDRRLVTQQPDLLFLGESSDQRAGLDVLLVLGRYDGPDHFVDLQGQLTSGRDDQSSGLVEHLNPLLGLVFVTLTGLLQVGEGSVNSLDEHVENGNSETEGLSLTCFGSHHHIDVSLQVDKGLPLDGSGHGELVSHQTLGQTLFHFELCPVLEGVFVVCLHI
mmetsp:Transcript_33627/g.51850  ORF Transcript_33627/g.51850 Transcript_33627/m.51850 type:complete len:204 (-) Transcript_33627:8-619(-)